MQAENDSVPIDDQIRYVKRALVSRRRIYNVQVATGRLSRDGADRQFRQVYRSMIAILETLREARDSRAPDEGQL